MAGRLPVGCGAYGADGDDLQPGHRAGPCRPQRLRDLPPEAGAAAVRDARVHADPLPRVLPRAHRGDRAGRRAGGAGAGPDGRVTAWIEVGAPDAQRLHRGSKLAGRAAVYTHRNVTQVLAELDGKAIHRAPEIPVYAFGRGFIDAIAAVVPRRAVVTVSLTERHLYLDLDGRAFD